MISRQDIAAMLGIDTELFRRTVESRPDFPAPVLRLSRKTVRWDEADVRKWIEAQRVRSQRSAVRYANQP